MTITCPYCGKKFERQTYKTTKPIRKSLILKYLDARKHAEVYYKYLRKKGYPLKRRTFQRDLKELEREGFIKMEVVLNKEGLGKKTFIKKIRRFS